jgi:hypothetical protein
MKRATLAVGAVIAATAAIVASSAQPTTICSRHNLDSGSPKVAEYHDVIAREWLFTRRSCVCLAQLLGRS